MEKKKYFINLRTVAHGIETVDEFETAKEVKKMIKEYRMSHPTGYYYMSSRSTNEWKNR